MSADAPLMLDPSLVGSFAALNGHSFATGGGGSSSATTQVNGYYPPSAYGFFSLSGPPESCPGQSLSSGDFFVTRMFVPANTAIVAVATAIQVAAVYNGSSTQNRYVIYEDDGTQAGLTPDDPTLWTSTGWRPAALSSPIAAQGSDRYVRVGATIAGMTGGSWPLTSGSNLGNFMNGGRGVTNVRFAYTGATTSPPASINPATGGQGYGMLFGLASS